MKPKCPRSGTTSSRTCPRPCRRISTRAPANPSRLEDLAPIFPMELIEQEMSPERWIPIPDEVQRIYKLWRPSPLHRARNLEKALKHPGPHLL